MEFLYFSIVPLSNLQWVLLVLRLLIPEPSPLLKWYQFFWVFLVLCLLIPEPSPLLKWYQLTLDWILSQWHNLCKQRFISNWELVLMQIRGDYTYSHLKFFIDIVLQTLSPHQSFCVSDIRCLIYLVLLYFWSYQLCAS